MKVEFDREAVARRYREAGARGMERLARQVLADSEEFMPLDSGALRRAGSAGTAPDGGGIVRWNAPHARALYRGERGGRPLRYRLDKNPRAQRAWFEAAKRKHGGWAALAARLFGGGG